MARDGRGFSLGRPWPIPPFLTCEAELMPSPATARHQNPGALPRVDAKDVHGLDCNPRLHEFVCCSFAGEAASVGAFPGAFLVGQGGAGAFLGWLTLPFLDWGGWPCPSVPTLVVRPDLPAARGARGQAARGVAGDGQPRAQSRQPVAEHEEEG